MLARTFARIDNWPGTWKPGPMDVTINSVRKQDITLIVRQWNRGDLCNLPEFWRLRPRKTRPTAICICLRKCGENKHIKAWPARTAGMG